jgi:hypothetical protein
VLHAAAAQAVAQDASAPGVPRLDRKIIYTAELDLVVENFSDVTARVEALVAQHEGYIANSNLQGSSGVRRSGVWSVRVPVARYKAFVDAARSIGEVRRQETKSQDVSEEYYDVEARIRNRKRTEEQLLKLLAERTGKLDDILTVERELSRVREEIERTEGRLRVLQDLSSLTTITLTIEEVKNYVPVEAATFGTRVRRAFDASLASLLVFAEAVLILFVAALPWLAVLSVPAVVGGVLARRRYKTARGAQLTP